MRKSFREKVKGVVSRAAPIVIFVALVGIVAACGENPPSTESTATPTVTATIQPTSTSVPTAQATSTSVPASAASPSPTATRPAQVVASPTPVQPTSTPRPTSTPVPELELVDSLGTVRPDNALIVDVVVSLNAEARVYIEYENENAGRFRSTTTTEAGMSHEIPILRLRPETTYDYQVFALDTQGEASSLGSRSFTTGPLPEPLAIVEMTQIGAPTSELVLLDSQTAVDDYLFAVDRDSQIVWYWLSPPHEDGILPAFRRGLRGVKQLDDYNLVFIDKSNGLLEINPLGEILAQFLPDEQSIIQGEEIQEIQIEDDLSDVGPHHDLLVMPDDRIIYLSHYTEQLDDTANGGASNTLVMGDQILEWDLTTNTTRELWNVFDFISPDDRVKWRVQFRGNSRRPWVDWTHANSLSIGPRGNILVSMRHINQIISINPDWQSIEWRLGGPGSDFTFPNPNDQFYHQHQAIEPEPGHIFLFDNGNQRPKAEGGDYSRGLELQLDFDNMTATKVWEYRNVPDIYSNSKSGIERLENGNTLVAFGGPAKEPLVTVEADAQGSPVWIHSFWSPTVIDRYRALPLDSIFGETRLN